MSHSQFTMDVWHGLGKADSLGKKSARFGAQLCSGARAHPGARSHGLWGQALITKYPSLVHPHRGWGMLAAQGHRPCWGEQHWISPALTCSISSK